MLVDPKNPTPKRLRNIFSQLCHKHLGSSSKMELVMEAFCLHWKLRAHFQRFSLVPPWDLCLLGKSNWRPCFQAFFGMCKRNNIFYERNIKLVFAHINSMCKSSNIFYMNETSNLCSCTCTTRASGSSIFFHSRMPQDVIIPTPPYHDRIIAAQPFWGGESAYSQKQPIPSSNIKSDC